MTLWRVSREDLRPLILISILPLLIAIPLLFGFLNADPAIYNSGATIGGFAPAADYGGFPVAPREMIVKRGLPVIDGNNGLTTQALGRGAALEILGGRLPWWNAYSGVGLPLAADYIPAAFFPLTFLLLLPQGMLLEHLLLQIIAGWGAYALLRQLKLSPLAALTGGVLFAFNGTLAWYDSAASLPLPFLPWMLFGIERAFAKAALGIRGGWRIFAIALALNLLGGFPEAAYLNGLMALGWALLRLIESKSESRWPFVWRMGLGGLVGLALTTPQTVVFLQSLPLSLSLAHEHGAQAYVHLYGIHAIPTLVAPYVFGPIYKYAPIWPASFQAWGGLGGYITASILVVASYSVIARPSPLGWFLLGWTLLALGKSFGIEPAVFLWNLVPGATDAAISRYVQPTWSLALTILAAYGIDDLLHSDRLRRRPLQGAILIAILATAGCAVFGVHYWPVVHISSGLRSWMLLTLIWAALAAFGCTALLARPTTRWSAPVLAILLMGESAFMFAVPTFGNVPGDARVDMRAIEFLRHNLDLGRFYTLGPIQPNYGAYFGIASINHNYLPIPLNWTKWDDVHLHGDTDDLELTYRGLLVGSAKPSTPLQLLNQDIPTLGWTGVKYVVAAPKEITAPTQMRLKKVYTDAAMEMFELPAVAPYFEIVSGQCKITPLDRTDATVDCATPATLLRRELFYPGWTAHVNEANTGITSYKELFQAIALPQGRSTVYFRYAPPHILWILLTALVGLLCLVGSWLLELNIGRYLAKYVSQPR